MGAQPVGISSHVVGDIRLTLLPDGYHRCDPQGSFPDSTAEDWSEHSHLLDDHGRLVMTMGALLVELPTGERVLLDLGFGPRTVVLADMAMEFWGGRLLASLNEFGLTPNDIDMVVYSHLHLDHVGWTCPSQDDATLTFPRARHIVHRTEWDHWTPVSGVGGPSEVDVAALSERIEFVDGGGPVLPGIDIVPTPGHTPGHCSFLITSGAERSVVLGDAIHCPLQLTHPEWAYVADVNPQASQRAREHLLRELEQPGTSVVGPHFPDAVFGRLLTTTAPHRVAFDIAPPAPVQPLAAEAPAGQMFLPALI